MPFEEEKKEKGNKFDVWSDVIRVSLQFASTDSNAAH